MSGPDTAVWQPGFGHPGFCAREANRAVSDTGVLQGKLVGGSNDDSLADILLQFSPTEYWRDVVVPATNKMDPKLNLTYDELVGWIGIRLLMATSPVSNVRDWFASQKKPCVATGVPVHLNPLMSGKRFFRINSVLSFSLPSDSASATVNRFREQTPMEDAWNTNMEQKYSPAELNVLDESVMFWLTRATCPGWMFLPRKPWPFGGEWHTISDKPNCIIHRVEYSQGRDRPVGVTKEFEREAGKGICSMILRLCKPLFGSGRTIHLDSGFCVLSVIARLLIHGLFSNAQIKKRRCAAADMRRDKK